MGYTHYFRRVKHLPPQAYAEFVDELRNFILPSLPEHTGTAGGWCSDGPLILAGWNGEGEPTIEPDDVRFNGGSPEGMDLSHETFALPRDLRPWGSDEGELYPIGDTGTFQRFHFEFCKTARKPYDLAVCLALLSAAHHFGPYIRIGSDGGPDDWAEARDLYLTLFPERQEAVDQVMARL